MPKLMEQHYFIQGVEMKKCPKCGELKPLSEFYSNVKTSDKLSSYCKDCTKDYNKIHSSEQTKVVDETSTQLCIMCGEIKPLSEFHKNSNSANGVQSICKECKKKMYRQRYIEHKETTPEPETISLRTNKEEIRPDAKVYDNIIVLDHQSKTHEHNIKVLKEAIEKKEYGPYDAALLETILSEIREIKVIVNKLCASDYDKQFALMQDVVLRMSKERGAA